jgi:para-aminobenzoate synthetase/4-amino-4-deoxychorismate lyase
VVAPISGAVVRFDDTRPGGVGVLLSDPRTILVAGDTADVVGVLEEAEAQAQAGRWVAGYVGYEAAAAFDAALATGRHRGSDELPLAWFAVFDRVDAAPPLLRRAEGTGRSALTGWRADVDAETYRDKVRRVRDHIAAGDTYQVNLTARLRAPLTGDPFDLYRDLALAQASEYCAYLDLGRFVIASASP